MQRAQNRVQVSIAPDRQFVCIHTLLDKSYLTVVVGLRLRAGRGFGFGAYVSRSASSL